MYRADNEPFHWNESDVREFILSQPEPPCPVEVKEFIMNPPYPVPEHGGDDDGLPV